MDTEEKKRSKKKGLILIFLSMLHLIIMPCLLLLSFQHHCYFLLSIGAWHGLRSNKKRCRRIQKAFLVKKNQMISCILNIILYHIWHPLGRVHNFSYKITLIHNHLSLMLFTIINYNNRSIHFCIQTLQTEIPA